MLQVLSLRAILQVSLCHNYLCVIKSVIMTGAPTNLRVVDYNRSRVNLEWEHPTVGYRIPSFAYVVTILPHGSSLKTEAFGREEDPSISIDLKGYECESVQIAVEVFGKEDEEAQFVNATLPSCE